MTTFLWNITWKVFFRRNTKAETPVLWPPHVKSWLIGKDSDAGRDWGQEEKGTTEDEMAGWYHQLDGYESEWTPGVDDDREAWRAAIHGVTKSQTRLSNWTELNGTDGERTEMIIYKTTYNLWLNKLEHYRNILYIF